MASESDLDGVFEGPWFAEPVLLSDELVDLGDVVRYSVGRERRPAWT